MAAIQAPPVHRIAIIQLAVLLVASGAVLLMDVAAACSLVIGGVIQIGPQAYFTRLAFRYRGARQATNVLRAMYMGETGKLLLTAVLFALTFFYVAPLHLPALFLGYMAMIVVLWFSTARVLNPKEH